MMMFVLFVGFVAETFRKTITVFFARDYIGVKNVGELYVAYFAVALVGVQFWRWLATRLGKHRALAGGFVVAITTNLAIFLLHQGDVALFFGLWMVKEFCFGALDLLPAAIVADTADVYRAMTRDSRAGFLFAIMGIVVNLGQAVGQGRSLILLELFGYQTAGGNGESQLFLLRCLYGLAPSVGLALALALLWNYPLTARRHKALRTRIDHRDARALEETP